jgi:hypothetical protein
MQHKISVLLFISLFISYTTFSQDDYEIKSSKERAKKEGLTEAGFKPERIFWGSGFNFGFSASQWGGNNFNIGLTPEIGYSITQWMDAGINLNLNYFSFSLNDGFDNYKQKSFNYGAGLFTRIYPIQELFITAVPEYNFIDSRIQVENNGPNFKIKQQAFSMLAGIGWGRRIVGESGFYTALLFDLANNESSPYITNNGAGEVSKLPIIRAGFTVYLKPKSQRK